MSKGRMVCTKDTILSHAGRLLQQLSFKEEAVAQGAGEKLRLQQQLNLFGDQKRAWVDRTSTLLAELEKTVCACTCKPLIF